MNEFTTVDNIKQAFSLILGDDYSLNFYEDQKTFYLFNTVTMKRMLTFEYDKESRKFSYYILTDYDFADTASSIFKQVMEFKTCQMISDAFFYHEISKIIFKDPIVFDEKTFHRSKNLGKQIKSSPNFYYRNAWNMIFVEMGYIVTENFNIKPIIDFCINLRGFGKIRFFVDEDAGTFTKLLDTTHYNLCTEQPDLSNTVGSIISSADVGVKDSVNDEPTLVNLNDYIQDFMIKLSTELYPFYVNQFNLVDISSEANGSLNDFKVLEMLKV
jgi:hypothetical protein